MTNKTRLPSGQVWMNNRRRGAILLLVMVVVVALSLICAALLRLGMANGTEGVRGLQNEQAFCVAEAGLQSAVAKLRAQTAFQLSPTNLTSFFLDGTYWVSVVMTGSTYYLNSTGMVGVCTRQIRQVVSVSSNNWPDPVLDYAIFDSGDVNFNANMNVVGNIFSFGNVNIGKNGSVSSGEVYAVGSVTGSGSFTVGTLPSPLPPQPVLDSTWYYAQIALAAATGVTTPSYNLMGGTVYVKGSIFPNVTINGPGILVVSGDVTFGNNATVTPNAMVISGGTMTFDNNGNAGSNDTFYASNSIVFNNNALLFGGCSLLTPGSVVANNNFALSGVLFAGGVITVKNNATVYGSIVGNLGFTGNNNVSVYHDPAYLPPTVPPGFTPGIAVRRISWSEPIGP